jgi:hypothetical protein
MNAQDIRNTITMLERTNSDFQYVAGRDFRLVTKVEKNGEVYALGMIEHDYDDNTKSDYSVYKLEREDGFEYNNKFYPQEFYSEVESLKLSPYVKPQVALDSFKSWLSKV